MPAAGVGSRMRSTCPKQYLSIDGKTILEHSVAALLRHADVERVVVSISPDDGYFYNLPLANDPRVQVVYGGAQRADSVLPVYKRRQMRIGC